MEHDDYNAILAIIRPAMKTIPGLNNIIEGSVETVLAISAQVAAARRNRELLKDLYDHASAVQAQVMLALRERSALDQEALLPRVRDFVEVLQAVVDFAAATGDTVRRGAVEKAKRGIVVFFKATSTAGKILEMKQKITDAALVFGIATNTCTEQRILDIKSI
ncbi:hypothetical protein BKA62DRAFT_261088 [Auriculariales sp. MPI-PUGE-AT-0066]|nr:hypothetical protein BKA62DRAFT_261088 [Auriculariales sp. MPI-PUGE-AT-0066]